MKSNILILFCCFLFLASCQAPSIEEYTLLPHPVDIKYIPGMVKLKTQPTLVYPGELANEALLLQCYLSSDFSVQATLKKNKKNNLLCKDAFSRMQRRSSILIKKDIRQAKSPRTVIR